MSNWPLLQAPYAQVEPENSLRVLVNKGTGVTFGAWTPVRETGPALEALSVHLPSFAPAHSHWQIGVGAAGAEVIIVDHCHSPGRLPGNDGLFQAGQEVYPVRVAEGARIAVRVRSRSSFLPHNAWINGLASSGYAPVGFGEARLLMDLEAAFLVHPVAAANGGAGTFGAWVSLGTLPYAVRGVALVINIVQQSGASLRGLQATIQLGILAGAQPTVIGAHFVSSEYEDWPIRGVGDVQCIALPAGTELYARYNAAPVGVNQPMRVNALLFR